MALELGIMTYQILTNNDEVCTPSLSSILLAVLILVIEKKGEQFGLIEWPDKDAMSFKVVRLERAM